LTITQNAELQRQRQAPQVLHVHAETRVRDPMLEIGRDAIGAPPALLDSQAGVPQQGNVEIPRMLGAERAAKDDTRLEVQNGLTRCSAGRTEFA
jgi:hypothetical protein